MSKTNRFHVKKIKDEVNVTVEEERKDRSPFYLLLKRNMWLWYILVLMISLEVKVSSKSSSPMIFLKVVALSDSMAEIGFTTPYVYNLGSVTLKNTTVSICMVTLSFVITGCGSKSRICSFIVTLLAIFSKNGIK